MIFNIDELKTGLNHYPEEVYDLLKFIGLDNAYIDANNNNNLSVLIDKIDHQFIGLLNNKTLFGGIYKILSNSKVECNKSLNINLLIEEIIANKDKILSAYRGNK